jgi:DNA-binding CsgD family transcriptional regulator/biotin operon repressor
MSTNPTSFDELFAAQRMMNVAGDYIFRAVGDFSALCGHDVTSALVFIAVTQLVTRHLRSRGAQSDDLEGAFFKDSLRQPTSIQSVAEAIGVSPQTVRRKVARLVERGLIKRTSQGKLIVNKQILMRPDVLAVVLRQRGNAEVLTYQLRKLPSSTLQTRAPRVLDEAEALKQARLTTREREVLGLLLEGRTAKEVARRLTLSHRTVELFRSKIIRKMGAKNLAAVAAQLTHSHDVSDTLDEALVEAY